MLRVEDEQQASIACADGRRRPAIVGGLAAAATSFRTGTGSVRVWDPAHGHYHDANGVQVSHRTMRSQIPNDQIPVWDWGLGFGFALALLMLPTIADAGQIYGTIVLGGQGARARRSRFSAGKKRP